MQQKKITSLANFRVKNIVQLRNRKHRRGTDATIVEGGREIIRALDSGVVFREVYICSELIKRAEVFGIIATLIKKFSSQQVPVYETTKSVFSKISYGDRAEGVLAVCAPQPLSLKDLCLKRHPLIVIVESVEKPGNLGAILRTCDGAGVDGIIICDGKTDIYNPNVIRASLGTVFSLRVVGSSNEEAFQFLRSKNIQICATSPTAKTVYTKTEFSGSLAVVVGSEQNGLTDFWLRHADFKVRIPMRGSADSLNVSASTAILLYEIVRQKSN